MNKMDYQRMLDNADQVNHPQHYGGNTVYEDIKVLEAKLTSEEFIGAMKFNVITYLTRALKKGTEDQDYAKAAWYANYLVDYRKRLANGHVGEGHPITKPIHDKKFMNEAEED